MATNYVQDGKTITNTVSGTVAAGDPLVIGSLLGVYLNDYTSGQSGVLATEGVWSLNKAAASSFTQGQDVYWDATSSTLVAAATGGELLGGVVWAAAATGTTEASVKINASNKKAVAAV